MSFLGMCLPGQVNGEVLQESGTSRLWKTWGVGKFDAPSLERVFRGWVCYKLVSEHETTLGLLGLMHESYENIFGGL
jgi:hypothetical protein